MTLLTFQKDDHPQTAGRPLPPMGSETAAPATAAAELAHLLFDREDRDRVHGTWRALIAGEEFRYRPGLSEEQRIARSYARLRLLNGALDSPEALAGDPRRLASLHEWTGVVDAALGTVAGIHYNLFLGSLLDHDPERRRNLSEFTSMQRTGTFLCTELDHGNDVAGLETTAALDRASGGFVLHTPTPGAQKFMPNTSMIGGPKSAVVAARLLIDGEDQGVCLFLTPLSDEHGPLPGVRIRMLPERTGVPLDHCLTSFDQVRLPREALMEADHGHLDHDGLVTGSLGSRRRRFLRSIGRVTVGKLCLSAKGVGVSRAALAIAVRYAHHRHISGPRAGERVPLAAHRSHHGRLLYALSKAYAMTFLHRTVVARWSQHTPEDRAEAERLTAIAKGWITWQARDITLECRERCGAQGLFPANGLADFPLNLESSITAEGDNLVVWVKAASEMVFGHQTTRPGSHHHSGTAEQALNDLGFLRALLADVEGIWQLRARAAVRRAPAKSPLNRWNAASSAGLEMVSTHASLNAADAFIAAAARATDPTAAHLLHGLCRLFLLRQLCAHTGDLLAEGALNNHHVRAWSNAMEEAIADLAPHMMTLVDAFDLPGEFLSAIPIASGGYLDRVLDD